MRNLRAAKSYGIGIQNDARFYLGGNVVHYAVSCLIRPFYCFVTTFFHGEWGRFRERQSI